MFLVFNSPSITAKNYIFRNYRSRKREVYPELQYLYGFVNQMGEQ
jgi:hypothetical protein